MAIFANISLFCFCFVFFPTQIFSCLPTLPLQIWKLVPPLHIHDLYVFYDNMQVCKCLQFVFGFETVQCVSTVLYIQNGIYYI